MNLVLRLLEVLEIPGNSVLNLLGHLDVLEVSGAKSVSVLGDILEVLLILKS